MSFWSHLMTWEFWQLVVSGAVGGVLALVGNAALALFKATLARKHERWAWFNAGRAKAIKKLYARLASAEDALKHFVAQPENDQLRVVAQRRRIEAHSYYQRNRIFFTQAVERKLIEGCTGRNLDAFLNAMASSDPLGGTIGWRTTAQSALDETQKLLQSLELEFRKALGIAKGHSTKGYA